MTQEKYYFNYPKSLIKSLTIKELEKVLNDYKSGVLVKDILKNLPKALNSNIFYKHLPYFITKEKCIHCDSLIYNKPLRRSEVRLELPINKLCISCNHDYTDGCTCTHCEKERTNKEIKKQELIYNYWKKYIDDNYSFKIDLKDISLNSEIQLLLIAKSLLTTDENIDLKNSKKDNSPSSPLRLNDQLNYILNDLLDRHIIIPSLDNDLNMHYLEEDRVILDKPNIFNILSFKYDFNIYDEGKKISPSEFFNYMENERVFTDIEKDTIWRDIYKTEIEQYTESLIQDLIYYDHDSEFYEYITDILIEDYSLSKACAIIYRSINNLKHIKLFPVPNDSSRTSLLRDEISKNAENHKNVKSINDINSNGDINTSEVHRFAMTSILGNIEGLFFHLKTKQILPNYKSNSV